MIQLSSELIEILDRANLLTLSQRAAIESYWLDQKQQQNPTKPSFVMKTLMFLFIAGITAIFIVGMQNPNVQPASNVAAFVSLLLFFATALVTGLILVHNCTLHSEKNYERLITPTNVSLLRKVPIIKRVGMNLMQGAMIVSMAAAGFIFTALCVAGMKLLIIVFVNANKMALKKFVADFEAAHPFQMRDVRVKVIS